MAHDDDLTRFEAHGAPPLPSVGHLVPVPQPEVFDAAMLGFLSER